MKFDLVVVGSGPAGRCAAIQAAKLNKTVVVIEQGRQVGGASVHTGTIHLRPFERQPLIFPVGESAVFMADLIGLNSRSALKICAAAYSSP